MSNVLSEAKKQQVIALGRLGWPLRRIEQETGVRRETASAYLKAAGVGVRPPGAWGRRAPAKPANEVTTGSDAGQVERTVNPNPENLIFKKGHRIRLDISSSNFPRFDVNPNTGEPLGLSRSIKIAENTVYHDPAHPSAVKLFLLPAIP